MIKIDKNKVKETLTRGVENIYPNPETLEKKLKSGQRIRLYCGYDATAPTLHIGHTVTLRKLAQFQDLGHEVIMLIGDFTTMIGDPTDKTAVRKKLTREEALKNAENYKKLASKILKFSGENPVKIMYNSQWNDKLSFIDLIELASNFTVQQMIIRDMFQKRMKQNKPIYLHEFLYPLTQAYDSVAMNVDLEIGASDQIFNMLCGRSLMRALKNKEKFVLATKLLVADASGKKMSKTENNMVRLDEKPEEMFGKIMSWPDEIIILNFELCTNVPMKEINKIDKQMKEGKINPRDAKARLAREITALCYDTATAQKAEQEFSQIFKEHKLPSEIPSVKINSQKINILDLLVQTKLAPSKGEAKRLIEQGGVKIDKRIIKDWRIEIQVKNEMIAQVGKRKFIRIRKDVIG